MPEIRFDKRTLEKAKKKQGVYSGMSRRPTPLVMDKRDIETLTKLMKPLVTEITRAAFLKYATHHGCKPENLEMEWIRFNRYLQKVL